MVGSGARVVYKCKFADRTQLPKACESAMSCPGTTARPCDVQADDGRNSTAPVASQLSARYGVFGSASGTRSIASSTCARTLFSWQTRVSQLLRCVLLRPAEYHPDNAPQALDIYYITITNDECDSGRVFLQKKKRFPRAKSRSSSCHQNYRGSQRRPFGCDTPFSFHQRWHAGQTRRACSLCYRLK